MKIAPSWGDHKAFVYKKLKRAKGFEPSTSSLGSWQSTSVPHIVLAPEGAIDEQLAAVIGDPNADQRRKSELAAEDFVIRHLVENEGFQEADCVRVGNVRFAGNKREGFDIRASRVIDHQTGETEVRRIEVKGRQKGASIVLTTNEWYKAQQLGKSYWLYVVWNPLGSNPDMVAIQDPANRLDHAKREIVASRYYEIPADALRPARGGVA